MNLRAAMRDALAESRAGNAQLAGMVPVVEGQGADLRRKRDLAPGAAAPRAPPGPRAASPPASPPASWLPGTLARPAGRPRRQTGGSRARRGDELVNQEKNEFGKLVQSLSLNREGRLAVLVSLDDRRLWEPLLLLSVYDRVPLQP